MSADQYLARPHRILSFSDLDDANYDDASVLGIEESELNTTAHSRLFVRRVKAAQGLQCEVRLKKLERFLEVCDLSQFEHIWAEDVMDLLIEMLQDDKRSPQIKLCCLRCLEAWVLKSPKAAQNIFDLPNIIHLIEKWMILLSDYRMQMLLVAILKAIMNYSAPELEQIIWPRSFAAVSTLKNFLNDVVKCVTERSREAIHAYVLAYNQNLQHQRGHQAVEMLQSNRITIKRGEPASVLADLDLANPPFNFQCNPFSKDITIEQNGRVEVIPFNRVANVSNTMERSRIVLTITFTSHSNFAEVDIVINDCTNPTTVKAIKDMVAPRPTVKGPSISFSADINQMTLSQPPVVSQSIQPYDDPDVWNEGDHRIKSPETLNTVPDSGMRREKISPQTSPQVAPAADQREEQITEYGPTISLQPDATACNVADAESEMHKGIKSNVFGKGRKAKYAPLSKKVSMVKDQIRRRKEIAKAGQDQYFNAAQTNHSPISHLHKEKVITTLMPAMPRSPARSKGNSKRGTTTKVQKKRNASDPNEKPASKKPSAAIGKSKRRRRDASSPSLSDGKPKAQRKPVCSHPCTPPPVSNLFGPEDHHRRKRTRRNPAKCSDPRMPTVDIATPIHTAALHIQHHGTPEQEFHSGATVKVRAPQQRLSHQELDAMGPDVEQGISHVFQKLGDDLRTVNLRMHSVETKAATELRDRLFTAVRQHDDETVKRLSEIHCLQREQADTTRKLREIVEGIVDDLADLHTHANERGLKKLEKQVAKAQMDVTSVALKGRKGLIDKFTESVSSTLNWLRNGVGPLR
eukprot:Clim_evm3s162 gene=Clim_evmTU3s162